MLHIHTSLTFPFQASQHINTPLTIQTPNFNPFTIQQLTVLPHLHPAPTLSTYPYQQIQHPILLHHITLSKGIHIRHTLIPIHIKHLSV
ncbi:DUF436 family protein, partial [Staphylococcus epidermidis]|uniref:DUF436 family protein n=1 Tax=Staphylococcus epidermidis TaxID=1282 RepID=UPI0037DA53FE